MQHNHAPWNCHFVICDSIIEATYLASFVLDCVTNHMKSKRLHMHVVDLWQHYVFCIYFQLALKYVVCISKNASACQTLGIPVSVTHPLLSLLCHLCIDVDSVQTRTCNYCIATSLNCLFCHSTCVPCTSIYIVVYIAISRAKLAIEMWAG